MVARLISVSDDTELSDLHDVFQRVLGWPVYRETLGPSGCRHFAPGHESVRLVEGNAWSGNAWGQSYNIHLYPAMTLDGCREIATKPSLTFAGAISDESNRSPKRYP